MRKFTDVECVHLRYVLSKVMARTVEEGFNVPIVDWAIKELAERFECTISDTDYASVLEKEYLETLLCLLDMLYSGEHPKGVDCIGHISAGSGKCVDIKRELLQRGLLTYKYLDNSGERRFLRKCRPIESKLVISDVGWEWIGRLSFKTFIATTKKCSSIFQVKFIQHRPMELLTELLVSDSVYLRRLAARSIARKESK